MSVTLIERRLDLLQPPFRSKIEAMIIELASLRIDLAVFETYRHPERQAALTRDVTKALPWQSAHQYGLACDFARPLGRTGYSWKVPAYHWRLLADAAIAQGLRVPSPEWDPGHVEDPAFQRIRTLLPVFD